MGALLLLTLLSSIFLVTDASESSCPVVKCGHGAPEITYPFHVKGLQRCGHPGFDLSCKENTTMIYFPDCGELVVKTISYDTRKIDLLDPKSCVHGVFLNLDLSLTPFRYYYDVKNYTYLNCSAKLSPSSFNEVSCLSGSRHHVYTVESSLPVPDSCRPVKTVAIPFSFSPYLSDNSFGLGLTWDMPGCGETNETKQRPASDKGNSQVSSLIPYLFRFFGHPGFDLSCKENTTMIYFPDCGELVVKTISYDTRKIDLLDPKSCVHGVFLNLDLSLTPFRYYYDVKNYTYLNCSAKLSPSSFNEVSCLSGSRHHVYTVESSLPVPDSCRPVKTVAIPFSFSPYLSDNSFGLGLTWDMPGCGETNETKQRPASDKGFQTKWVATVLGISIFILAAALVLRIKIQRPKKLDGQMGKENQLEGEKLLGEHV